MAKKVEVEEWIQNGLFKFIGRTVTDANFQDLLNVAKKIATRKSSISKEERAAVIDYLDYWKTSMQSKIEQKKECLLEIKSFFTVTRTEYGTVSNYYEGTFGCHGQFNKPVITVIIDILKNSKKKNFIEIAQCFEDIGVNVISVGMDVQYINRQDYLPNEEDMDYDKRVIAQKKYEFYFEKQRIDNERKTFEIRRDFFKVRRRLLNNKSIANLVGYLSKEISNTYTASKLIEERVSAVKLAISCDDFEIIDQLKIFDSIQRETS